ncbi:MAG: threonine-phosphate decarboxylase CobD [Primorskyibacter sp.]
MRDHGGDLDRAIAQYGGMPRDWLDLSTGINPDAYPVPDLNARAWTALPTKADLRALEHAAARAYGAQGPLVALAGAQAAIQLVPRLQPNTPRPTPRPCARVLGPTYNEHGAALRAAGWAVDVVVGLEDLAGADLAVVVNPNNPDGQAHDPQALERLAPTVGRLVVDESFGDVTPGLSMVPGLHIGPSNIMVLRSFGKFYGLAGVRLGFALGQRAEIDHLREMAGPWAVSGPAVAIGQAALRDTDWHIRTRAALVTGAARLDALACAAGWTLVGGTSLFRTYRTPDAATAQARLATHHIWSRIFPYDPHWIRLGLPPQTRWPQVDAAFEAKLKD